MPQYQTYIELPIIVDYEWDEGNANITSIELREEATFKPMKDGAKLPEVKLEELLSEKELQYIEEDIKQNESDYSDFDEPEE